MSYLYIGLMQFSSFYSEYLLHPISISNLLKVTPHCPQPAVFTSDHTFSQQGQQSQVLQSRLMNHLVFLLMSTNIEPVVKQLCISIVTIFYCFNFIVKTYPLSHSNVPMSSNSQHSSLLFHISLNNSYHLVFYIYHFVSSFLTLPFTFSWLPLQSLF